MSPEKSSHVVHENGKKRARHGRLAIPRQSLIRESENPTRDVRFRQIRRRSFRLAGCPPPKPDAEAAAGEVRIEGRADAEQGLRRSGF